MSLYLQQSGDERRPPLVLIHGWGMHSDVWLPWLPALQRHFSVLRVDLPGMGRSVAAFSPPSDVETDQSYRLEVVAAQVSACVAARVRQPAIWLGWSLGGLVAAEVARQAADQVAGLVTLASNPCFVRRDDYDCAMAADTFAQFQRELQQDWLKTLNRFVMLMAQGDARPRQRVKQLKTLLQVYEHAAGDTRRDPQRPGVAQVSAGLAASLSLLQTDGRSLLQGLSVPRLHLFADQDGLVPVAAARQAAMAPYAAVIDNSGHLPFLSQPEQTLQRLLHFVSTRVPAPAPASSSGAVGAPG